MIARFCWKLLARYCQNQTAIFANVIFPDFYFEKEIKSLLLVKCCKFHLKIFGVSSKYLLSCSDGATDRVVEAWPASHRHLQGHDMVAILMICCCCSAQTWNIFVPDDILKMIVTSFLAFQKKFQEPDFIK